MKRVTFGIVFILLLGISGSAGALIELEYVHIRVVDVGHGCCCIISMPDDQYMIFDAGSHEISTDDPTDPCLVSDHLDEMVPDGQEIDLLVVSHQHTDHYDLVSNIFGCTDAPGLDKILRTDYFEPKTADGDDPPGTSRRNDWINEISVIPDIENVDECYLLEDADGPYILCGENRIHFGEEIPWFDDVVLTFQSGWSHCEFSGTSPNQTSIVLKLEYAGQSVLFTGDICGCSDDHCTGCEACIVDNHYDTDSPVNVEADVMIAPHHGSTTSSSIELIRAVDPHYVIFTAGSKWRHPYWKCAERYINYFNMMGYPTCNIFRTDYGDDSGYGEWYEGRIPGNTDEPGDDNIDIYIYENGYLCVNWMEPDRYY